MNEMNEPISHEEFQRYLDLLSTLLKLGSSRRASITDELRAHLEERFTALTSRGVEPGEAISMALAEFGDVATLAAEFSAANRLRQRRWMMRMTIGSLAACVVAVVAALTLLPGGDSEMAPEAAFAQIPAKTTAEKPTEPPAEVDSEQADANTSVDPNTEALANLQKKISVDFIE